MKSVASVTSLPPLSCTCNSLSKPKTQRFIQIRSQSFKDEGSSSNLVDANLGVLRARMEQVMKNEKLKYTTLKRMNNSIRPIDYESQDKNGNAAAMTRTMVVMGLVGGSIGFVFLLGSLLITVVSVFVRLCL